MSEFRCALAYLDEWIQRCVWVFVSVCVCVECMCVALGGEIGEERRGGKIGQEIREERRGGEERAAV